MPLLLDDMSDLKGQMRILEEKNTSYMQTNMELEEVSAKYIILQRIKTVKVQPFQTGVV